MTFDASRLPTAIAGAASRTVFSSHALSAGVSKEDAEIFDDARSYDTSFVSSRSRVRRSIAESRWRTFAVSTSTRRASPKGVRTSARAVASTRVS